MGKKSREKKQRKEQGEKSAAVEAMLSPQARAELEKVTGSGDLRLIPAHIEHFIAGNEQARFALRALGRDAAVPVMRAAKELAHAELEDFAQKLFATKPAVETNLMILREVSVMEQVEAGRGRSMPTDGAKVTIRGTQVGLFDPARHAKTLARGGRPRNEPAALGAGEIAWFLLAPEQEAELECRMEARTEGSLALRLRVSSGLVFIGSPEASDGPRLGELRLDPFHTGFDGHVGAGAFIELAPGLYEVGALRTAPGKVRLSFAPLPESSPSALVDLAALALP